MSPRPARLRGGAPARRAAPRRARPWRWVLGGVLALLLVSGLLLVDCTGTRPTLQPEPDPVSVAAWSEGFCTGYRTWIEAIDEAGTTAAEAVDPEDRSGTRDALEALFSASSTATDELVAGLRRAAPPDVAGGRTFARDLTARFVAYDDALDQALVSAQALDVEDEGRFLVQAAALRDDHRAARTEVQEAFATLGDSAAGDALAAAVEDDCTA